VRPDEVYVESRISIGPGDLFVAYSDGITEAQNFERQEYGDERLCQLLQRSRTRKLHPSMVLEALRYELGQFTGSQTPSDDRTAVMIRLVDHPAPSREPHAQRPAPELFTIKRELGALGELRGRIGAAASILSEEDRDALQLAAFEAATNVVRHVARPHADATLCCGIEIADAAVSVELTYGGRPFEPPPEVAIDFSGATEGGFGLYIIEQSVDAVEYGNPMRGICSIRLTKRASQRQVGDDGDHVY
jgi:anti-sigma regulatory factor (Ser/Thr protein kinase)